MKKILTMLLLATLAMLVLPQIALAGEQPQHATRSHNSDVGDSHEGSGGDRGESGDHQNEEEHVNASFHIRLEGDQQVPAVTTEAFGFAKVELVNTTTLEFKVVVCDIANVTLAHIHVGAAGANGKPVVGFFDAKGGPFSSPDGCSTLAEGTRTPADLIVRPESGINNWNDFVHALLTNNTYVNVHTTANPNGEIRGQLVLHAEHEPEQEQNDQAELGDAESND